MNLRLFLAGAIWLVPAALLACGKDKNKGPSEDLIQVVDLGPVAVHDTGGFTGDLAVDIPDGAGSVVAYCGNFGDSQLGQVWYVKDNGNQIWDGDAPNQGNFRGEWLDDMVPTLVPLSPLTPLNAGTWSFDFWIGGGNPGSVDCGAVIRLDQPGTDANVLVELVFVGMGLSAADAETDTAFQQVLTQFEEEWGTAGLNVDYVYTDFSGDTSRFQVVDVSDDDYSEFNDLLRTANPENSRTLTFFLVEEIANSSAGGATILGLSAGPPGAAAIPGTSKSGVIVSAVDYADAPGDVAKIMAHEGGHFLGLYHTTEKDGSQHDPIADSPQCPASNDADGNGTMNSSECAGQGAENVMWWTLTQGTASFSNDQGWVVRRSPVAD